MIRISIIGMGMIGTSLGLALRASNPPDKLNITGYDLDRSALNTARARLAIDRAAHSLDEAVREAQLVVVAAPVQATRAIFAQIAPLLPAGAVVTDVASTRAQVCAWARELLPETASFVGGHPMAGKEQAGPEAAEASLFEGAIYCLTPSPDATEHAIDTVEGMVTLIGAKPYYIDPDEHDAYVAGISHLPFVLSTALVEVVTRSAGWKEMSPLAASGFRDISRLASGDVVMHRDICMTNRAALTHWINEAVAFLLEMRDHLEQDDAAHIEAIFEHARHMRDEWLARGRSKRPGESSYAGSPSIQRGLFGGRLPLRK